MSRVVVITRTKNRPLLLTRAVNSVRQQSYSDYVHIIINDGGEPSAVDALIASTNDARIQVIHNKKSLGMEAASNIGLRSQQAEYAVIHDDDDSWHHDFLAIMIAYLDANPQAAGAVCNINQIFESVTDEFVIKHSERAFNPMVNRFRQADFFVVNQFVPIAFIYRYTLHDEIGFFNEELKVCGDLDFHLRILQSHSIIKLKAFLANYHIRVQSENLNHHNSVQDKKLHLVNSKKIIEAYDNRTLALRILSYLRVKFFYRGLNVLYRLFKS